MQYIYTLARVMESAFDNWVLGYLNALAGLVCLLTLLILC